MSFIESPYAGSNPALTAAAPMLKLVDRLDLGSSAVRRVGSSPTWGTKCRVVKMSRRTTAEGRHEVLKIPAERRRGSIPLSAANYYSIIVERH